METASITINFSNLDAETRPAAVIDLLSTTSELGKIITQFELGSHHYGGADLVCIGGSDGWHDAITRARPT